MLNKMFKEHSDFRQKKSGLTSLPSDVLYKKTALSRQIGFYSLPQMSFVISCKWAESLLRTVHLK